MSVSTTERRERSDEVTGYVSGNGKYRNRGIAFVSSWKKFIHVVKSFELAFRDFALSSHLFIPSQKSILSLNPPSHQEYRK